MAKLVDYLIEDVRDSSENNEFSDTIGIQDKEFLRYLNDAQHRIHAKIVKLHPSVYNAEDIQTVVSGQESYNIPVDAFMGNRISQVDYSYSGNDIDYFPLRPTGLSNRLSGSDGCPQYYIRQAGRIILSPIPNDRAGSLRITYIKRIATLDKRRGSVASVTITDNVITSLFLDVATDTVDATTLNKNTRFTIVDSEGNIKSKNVLYTSINASTGEVIIPATFSLDSSESIEVGDYIVSGPYATTHSSLDNIVERYLIEYATMKILERDSSTDVQVQSAILQQIETDIVESYSNMSDDIIEIPILDRWY